MTDPVDRVRRLRPDVPDEHGWATSPAGRQALARVEAAAATPRVPWWRRRAFVLPAIVIGLGGTVAGSVAFAGAGRQTIAATDLSCVTDPTPRADTYAMNVDPTTSRAGLARTCLDSWSSAVPNRPAPTAFVICLFPVERGQSGGGQVGVPTTTSLPERDWPSACQAAGFDPLG